MTTTTTPTTTEATMSTTTVHPATEADAAVPFGGGNYTLACTCGERITYAGEQFTRVEAARHAAWHAKAGK